MAVVNALRTKISLDSAQFQQSLSSVNRQLKSLQQEQRAVTSSGTGFARGLDEMRAKADVLNRTYQVQQKQVEELRRRYEESRKATGENSKETQNAQIAYNKAVAEMNRTENALKGLTAEIERQENPWLRLQGHLDETGRKMQDIGKNMTSFGRSWSMRVTAPILAAGGAALKVGMDFEAGMSKVQALSSATAEEMEKMSEQAKELGRETVFSASQAAEAQAFLAMAGYDTNSILESMPGLLNLAASGNVDLGRAADITTNIMSAFNIEAERTGEVADILAYASANANTNLEQMGEAMKYVAPTSNTLGLSIEDTAAAIMAVSDAGIQGSQAGRAFGTSLLRLSNPTSAMADQMEELGISFFDAEGVIKTLPDIIGELETSMADYNSEQRAAALSTIFGTEAQRHWAILLDRGSDALRQNSKELANSEGTAERMAKTMQDNARGAMVELRSALEGVGIAISEHVIPTFTDLIRGGTDLVRKFGELDDGTQKNIIKMGLFAAAIGPVAIVSGSLTTAIGGLVRGMSGLAGIIGLTRGGGLLARMTSLLGRAGPVGIGIGLVTALGGAIWGLTRNKEELNEVNFEAIEKMSEEVLAVDELINEYEALQRQNRLTTDEMLEYMDILSDLSKTDSPDKIEELTKRQEELLEKSGFTNEEMQEFLNLNETIIEMSPEVQKAISDEGNAYAENIDIIKELNEENRKRLLIEAEHELIKALENQAILFERERDLVSEIKQLDDDINQNRQDRIRVSQDLTNAQEEYHRIAEEINSFEGEQTAEAQQQLLALQGKLFGLDELIYKLEDEQELLEEQYSTLVDQYETKQNSVDETREELRETEALMYRYEQLVLAQHDITAEKGKGLSTVQETIRQLERERDQLRRLHNEGKILTDEYQNGVSRIDDQIKSLEEAKGQLEDVNELAGQTIYKSVRPSLDVGSLSNIERRLSAPISKTLTVNARAGVGFSAGTGLNIAPMYAEGTSFHPGGPFIAGEEGLELGKLGSRFELLPFGMYDRPSGYKVFTHDETKKILNSLNNIPAYQGGARTPMDVSNLVNNNNMANVESLLQQLIYAVREGKNIVLNGRVVGQEVAPYVTEEQERTNRIRGAFV